MLYMLVPRTEKIEDVFIADTFFSRMKGYMFQRNPSHKAILIKPCNSIHTFFMNFNIDVLFINEDMEIVKKVEGLKPGKLILPVKDATMVLEGEEGAFEDIEVGNKIIL